jgi:TatA/E family protein of Tat protein translocase
MSQQTVQWAAYSTYRQGGRQMLALINDTGIVILIIAVVLLFGASQIPKVARNIAEAGKEFRKAHAELEETNAPPPADEKVSLTLGELNTLLRNQVEAGNRQGG